LSNIRGKGPVGVGSVEEPLAWYGRLNRGRTTSFHTNHPTKEIPFSYIKCSAEE